MNGVRLFRQALPQRLFVELEQRMRGLSGNLADLAAQSSWVDLQRISTSVADRTIAYLRPLLDLPPEVQGAEWWVRRAPAEKEGPWHFDKDERLARREGVCSHPRLSSVLYLCDVGGPTIVTNEVFAYGGEFFGTNGSPLEAVAVRPERNRFLVFPGSLHHRVKGAPGVRDLRLTFLVNWWAGPPIEDEAPAALREALSVDDFDFGPDSRTLETAPSYPLEAAERYRVQRRA